MDEAKLRVEADQGHKAKSFLENPTFKAAVSGVESDLWEEWKRTPGNEPGALQYIKYQIEGLNLVLTKLRKTAQTGDLAQRQLRDIDG